MEELPRWRRSRSVGGGGRRRLSGNGGGGGRRGVRGSESGEEEWGQSVKEDRMAFSSSALQDKALLLNSIAVALLTREALLLCL